MTSLCRICGSTEPAQRIQAREMMFGTQEAFDYALCSACGCLQIDQVPADLARHYPEGYYSHQPRDEPATQGLLKRRLMRAYSHAAALAHGRPASRLLRKVLPRPTDWDVVGGYLENAGLRDRHEPILDVGCGSAPYRLAAMQRCGFDQVQGIDPFVAHDLRCAAALLRPQGVCLVRVPVMGTWFWREFGIHWIELDAPRHLYLLSMRSMAQLARRSGFVIRKVVFDSHGWEIAGSQLYQRGIAWSQPKVLADNFDAPAMASFEAHARELNAQSDGGRACFYLQRA